MQTLIATHSPWTPQNEIEELISSLGVGHNRFGHDACSRSMIAWHDEVFEKKSSVVPSLRVEKNSKAEARRIFSNSGNKVWGWCDHRSTWLLDFWEAFSSDINFLLFYTPARTAVGRMINDYGNEIDLNIIIEEWIAYHAEMLRFHQQHRSRSLLISTDVAFHNRSEFAGLVARQFGIDVKLRQLKTEWNSHLSLLSKLAADLFLQNKRNAINLEEEILRTIPLFGSNFPHDSSMTGPQMELAIIREIRNQNQELRTQQEQIKQLDLAVNTLSEELESAQKKADETSRYFDDERKEMQAQVALLQSDLDIASDDLSRLEGIEEIVARKDNDLEKHRLELDALVQHSRDVHAEVERNFIRWQEQKALCETLSKSLAGIQAHYPDVVIFDDILSIPSENIRWKITRLQTAHGFVDTLDLEASVYADKPVLLVSPSATSEHLLSALFTLPSAVKTEDGRLVISPKAAVTDPEYLTIRLLSVGALDALDQACQLARQFIVKTSHAKFLELIGQIQRLFSKLPKTLRFSDMKIERNFIPPAYESLQFTLQECHYGNRKWKSFAFRFSATYSRGMLTQPRLEFPLFDPENKPFENWFIESSDDRGERLELRFDTGAEQFDSAVWQQLSPTDQLQLLAIIARLPTLLELGTIASSYGRPSDKNDWIRLSLAMQNTLLKHGLPANTFMIV